MHDLSKSYGDVDAISNVDLEINAGEVFGYLGPNGAGKTTTIRVLLDFIRPTGGGASIFGLDSVESSRDIRGRIGYLPGEMTLYEKLTGRESLTYAASLRGGVDWRYVDELAERLEADLSRQIRTLSRGNRQKIGLVQAFMNRPELIIMDEPSSGLDPLLQQQFHAMVDEAREEGRTVFISSHILPEVERVCDRVAIIREGRLVTVEDIGVLRERALHRLEFHIAGPVTVEDFAAVSGVRDLTVVNGVLRCNILGSPDALVKAVARFEVTRVVSQEPHLEDVFLSYYGEGDGNAA
jgi:ABC-2 type transport system ATP-binding protein